MSVDLLEVPSDIVLAVGERIVFPLPSYAGSGNSWSVRCGRGNAVVDARVELDPSQSAPLAEGDGREEPPQPALVPEHLVVFGLAVGEDACRLDLSRTFGGPQPTASCEVRVTVVAASQSRQPSPE